ncbi:phosphoglycolate phosphatase-like HAD superfamily hydrolase [Povalibacter uvarum]|uniref:Phosphoglycolate phosphatase-like HAD superfamily hydrolase n=1 Tax=Povalibacter uvarum TaxID=732238 RepID=A0A841HRE3_9GAMM|nr:HAD family hydrolase [Povalibacter uvarum]MBB6095214.1 phosphoglycolate phosphatase-like HAD superfamily hydrolase [Povalibacter uvarum]
MRAIASLQALLMCLLVASQPAIAAAPDPLPSWNDGPSKQAIVKFVADTTRQGSTTFVAPEARIAVFDNDGTLWSEQPAYFQLLFALDRVKALAPQHPDWKTKQPFKGVIEGDTKAVMASGEKGLLELIAVTHAGMTTEEFSKTVTDWIATAKHPRFKRPYNELVFQPMLEVLAYLRANGFKTYIVSGGGIEFMRPWASKVYGIPPEQIVGSSGKVKYEIRNGKPVLVKLAEVDFVDDKEGKPAGINKFIGRVPVFAFGNSDGDHQMLQWTAAGGGTRFMGIVHHTDAKREWAYDRKSHIGTLDKAWDEATQKGWTVVDMQKEWKVIYPWEQK